MLFLVLTLLTVSIQAQDWENPANKYKNAHKKYLGATCPIPKDNIQHFVYFAKDRASIIDHPLLEHAMFKGAQIMYSWKSLEPKKGKYDFAALKKDYEYLKSYGKKLFIQLQDATFYPKYNAVPKYLLSDEYGGGAALQYDDHGITLMAGSPNAGMKKYKSDLPYCLKPWEKNSMERLKELIYRKQPLVLMRKQSQISPKRDISKV